MALTNLTPKGLECMGGIGCPAVYSTDRNTFILVGRRLQPDDPTLNAEVHKSSDEEIIEVPMELLERLLAK